jgi:hypothetical protein
MRMPKGQIPDARFLDSQVTSRLWPTVGNCLHDSKPSKQTFRRQENKRSGKKSTNRKQVRNEITRRMHCGNVYIFVRNLVLSCRIWGFLSSGYEELYLLVYNVKFPCIHFIYKLQWNSFGKQDSWWWSNVAETCRKEAEKELIIVSLH